MEPIEAVYFLERSASLSSASAEHAEQAARALHRTLLAARPTSGSSATGAATRTGAEDAVCATEPSAAAEPEDAPPIILVAVDLARASRPFRLVQD